MTPSCPTTEGAATKWYWSRRFHIFLQQLNKQLWIFWMLRRYFKVA